MELEQAKELVGFVHEKGLIIMDYVHEVCQKENIPYSLFAGTMIGAVRNNGFIPWDDDIDIIMLRPDFDRFFEAVKKYPHPDIHAVMGGNHWMTRLTFKQPFKFNNMLVLNINADIFALDKKPQDPAKHKKLIKKYKFHQAMCRIVNPFNKAHGLKFKQKLYIMFAGALGFLQSEKGRCRRINGLAKKYSNTDTTNYFCSSDIYGDMGVEYKLEWLGTVDMPFAGRTYKIYSGFNEILRQQYGDYMTPPPEDKRYILNHVKWFHADRKLKPIQRIKVKRYLRRKFDL